MAIQGFKAYQIHTAMCAHFSDKSDYDYFKYKGKTNVSPHKFALDKTKRFKYGGVEKRVGLDDLELFFFVNLTNNPFVKFLPQSFYGTYKRYKDHLKTFKHTFSDDLEYIVDVRDRYDDLWCGSENHLYPGLYYMAEKGLISQLTFDIINDKVLTIMDDKYSTDPLNWTQRVAEYNQNRRPFVKNIVFPYLRNMDELVECARGTLIEGE